MKLDAAQSTLARLCLDRTPRDEDLTALGGDPLRWLLYRHLVRGRFVDTFSDALPVATRALGREALGTMVERWLAERPPTTRYVRELSLQFADFALDHALPEGAPPWTADALRWDAAVMRCHIADDAERVPVGPFAMDRPVVLTPARALLRLRWSVHRDEVPTEGEHALLVFRAEDSLRVEALTLDAFSFALVTAMGAPHTSLTGAVYDVLARHGEHANADVAAVLASLLGDLLERGIVRGSAPDGA